MSSTTTPDISPETSPITPEMMAFWALMSIVAVVVIRILMVEHEFDRANSGFLPILSYFLEHLSHDDAQWIEAYDQLRNGISIRGTEPVSRKSISWRQHRRWAWFLTVLEWKQKVTFAPPAAMQTQPHTSTRDRRLNNGDWSKSVEKDLESGRFKLEPISPAGLSTPPEVLSSLLDNQHKLLLVYGMHIIDIPESQSHVPNFERIRRLEARRLAFLLMLTMSILLFRSWYFALCYIAAPIPLAIYGAVNRMDLEDVEFATCVFSRSDRIELASRVIAEQFPTRDSSIDVLLFYRNRRAWCRCSPQPPGPNSDTWIELMMPTDTPWRNRVYRALNRLVHTILPWGHSANWTQNMIYGGFVVAGAAAGPIFAIISFVLIWVPKWAPQTASSPWGDGDVWTIAWYLLLLHWILPRALLHYIPSLMVWILTAAKGLGFPNVPAMPPNLNSSVTSHNGTAKPTVNPS